MDVTGRDTAAGTAQAEGSRKSYDAFISYARADAAFASVLQRGLQHLAKPWNRRRAMEVFRDETSLAASPGLWPAIRAALDASRWFVLLACPDAARSDWVGQEITYWISDKGTDHLLVVVTDGTWIWDKHSGDLSPSSTAANPALIGALPAEPKYLDMTWARRESGLTLRNARFRDQVATLAAAIREVPKEEIEGEDVRQERRTRRIARAVIAALTVLVLVTSVLAVVANILRQEAVRQRDAAISGQLTVQSEALDGTDPITAARLAAAAWHFDPTAQARVALLDALAQPERAVLAGGPGAVTAVAFSPDGKTLATASMGIVRLWDIATQRQIGAPMSVGANSVVRTLAFSPDGKTLATMSGGSISTTTSSVGLWNVATQRQTGVLVGGSGSVISGSIDAVALSPDWKTMATADGGAVQLWSLATRRQISKLATGGSPTEVQEMEFSPDGKLLATTSSTDGTQLWSVGTGKRIGPAIGKQIRVPFGNVNLFTGQNPGGNAAFSPSGKLLATASGGGARFWTVPAAQQIGKALPPPGGLREYIAFSPDGKLLAVIDGVGTVTLWNVATHQQVGTPLRAINSPVDVIAFSPHGNFLATANGDGTARLWNLAIWRQIGGPFYPATGVKNSVSAFALSQNNRMLAAGASNGTLRLWRVKGQHQIGTLALIRSFRYDDAQVVAFSPDGQILATATDVVVQLWNMGTHSQIGMPIRVGNSTDITALAFSPGGKVLAIACSNTARLWSVATHRQLGAALTIGNGLPSGVNALSFGPGGKTLATASNDEAALWDVATHHRLVLFRIGPPETTTSAVFKNVSKVAFSSGGRTLAAATGGGVRLWDMATHHEIGSLLSPGAATPFVNDLAFTPNGETIAIASGDSVTLWDVTTREQIGTPMTVGTSNNAGPYLLIFSPDGSILAAASPAPEGTAAVSLFDVALPASPIKAVCSMAHASLSRQEWRTYIPSEPFQQVCL